MFRRLLKWIVVLFGGFVALGAVVSTFSGPTKPKTEAEKAADIEREQAQATRREAENAAESAKAEENRLEAVRTTAIAESQVRIKHSLRDPDSLEWDKILSNADGSVLCFVYRAKNGFGGMNQEVTVLANNEYRNDVKAWKKNCRSSSMIDMHARLF